MTVNHFSEEERAEQVKQHVSVLNNQDIDTSLIAEVQKNMAALCKATYQDYPGYIFKYLIYSSRGYEDAANKDVIKTIEKELISKGFLKQIPADKMCTTDFTVTLGNNKYLVKIQKNTGIYPLIHKTIKEQITSEEEAKDIKDIQSLYTYFANVFIKKIYLNNQDKKIKELYKNLMAEVTDDHQGDLASEFTATAKEYGNTKALIINSTNDTTQNEHNIYASHNIYTSHSTSNTRSNTSSSVLFVPTSLFNKRDKVADNQVTSSVLSIPKYVDFQSMDTEEDSLQPKRDKIIYCLEQTFVENIGTLTEEQKKENEINYNAAVKKVRDTLYMIDLLMKDLAALSRNSSEFSKKVREFTKQKLTILTKKLNDEGLTIHIYDNTPKIIGSEEQNRLLSLFLSSRNISSIPILESHIPTDQTPLKDEIDKNINTENFVNSFIKNEIINYIQHNTLTKLVDKKETELNIPKIVDLHQRGRKLDKHALTQYVEKSSLIKNNLLITKEIVLPNGSPLKIHFYLKNNLDKKIKETSDHANGIQYGLEYTYVIMKLIEHIIEEVKVNNPFNLKINYEKIDGLQEKYREKLLEKYLFSAESGAIPKIDINNPSNTEYEELNNAAAILYRNCQFTLPKENDTDQVRPIYFEIVIENPNFQDKSLIKSI